MASVKSNKGRPVRYLGGYSMLFHYASNNGEIEYWRCTQYKTCSARAKLKVGSGEFKLNDGSTHSHVVDPTSPTKRERKTVLKERAAASIATPSVTLAADAHSELSLEELQSMPSLRSLQKTVNYVRKEDLGGGPADKEPSTLVLPENLKKTVRGARFLLVDSRVKEPDAPVFFAFASDDGASLLRDNRMWCLDGTFFACPKYFDSLLIISAMVENSCLPAIYIVLPDRTQVTYERAIAACFEAEPFRGISPESYICDFVLGLSAGMKKQFVLALLKRCFFHLCKNAWLQVQLKGLLPIYGINKVRMLLRSFASLAFLPVDEVSMGYEELCVALTALVESGDIAHQFVDGVNRYVAYFGNTYTGRVLGRQARPPSRTLGAEPRTNNGNEGFNASLNSRFPKQNPVMSQFLIRIIKEEERTQNIVNRHRANPAEPVRGRPSQVSVREANLRTLVANYANTAFADRKRLDYLELV
ncbi:hypothetical protein AAVH_24453 [Aphelenchoides avenae]|nr:hypothetical protein AAVH_24453 [Aphelenchus avenae]